MKKIIALIAALMMLLSLTSCFATNSGSSTADEAKGADVSTYDKDFKGLVKYIADRNSGCAEQELYYDILGADNGTRLIFNNNPYVEIYDFSSAAADPSYSEKATAILNDIKDDGAFKPMDDGVEMTGVITDSGKYVLAWDASRNYNYDGNDTKVATDELKANW